MEWRIEVVPLEHIGTDPNAAKGFMERRYNLSTTGLTNAELADALRPLLIRALARDARFRLREVVRLREEQQLPVGELPALLANYPDPDANPTPSLPAAESSKTSTPRWKHCCRRMPVVSASCSRTIRSTAVSIVTR